MAAQLGVSASVEYSFSKAQNLFKNVLDQTLHAELDYVAGVVAGRLPNNRQNIDRKLNDIAVEGVKSAISEIPVIGNSLASVLGSVAKHFLDKKESDDMDKESMTMRKSLYDFHSDTIKIITRIAAREAAVRWEMAINHYIAYDAIITFAVQGAIRVVSYLSTQNAPITVENIILGLIAGHPTAKVGWSFHNTAIAIQDKITEEVFSGRPINATAEGFYGRAGCLCNDKYYVGPLKGAPSTPTSPAQKVYNTLRRVSQIWVPDEHGFTKMHTDTADHEGAVPKYGYIQFAETKEFEQFKKMGKTEGYIAHTPHAALVTPDKKPKAKFVDSKVILEYIEYRKTEANPKSFNAYIGAVAFFKGKLAGTADKYLPLAGFENCCFSLATLEYCEFGQCNAGLLLEHTTLKNCRAKKDSLSSVDISYSTIDECDFTAEDGVLTNFSYSKITKSKFAGIGQFLTCIGTVIDKETRDSMRVKISSGHGPSAMLLQNLLVYRREDTRYVEARRKLLQSDELDVHTVSTIKALLGVTTLKLPLNESQLDQVPNLFDKEGSEKFWRLEQVLLKLSSRDAIANYAGWSPLISGYFYELLDNENGVSDNVKLTVVHMLLAMHFGKKGDCIPGTRRKEVCKSIQRFMSGKSTDITGLHYLEKPLRVLKQYTSHQDSWLRMGVRSICESLFLPINLFQMLSFSIEGMLGTDNTARPAVIVMGPTGAGKSTFVNYLHGATFKLVNPVMNRRYLELDPPDQRVPAVMGRGEETSSVTLYPQIVRTDKFSFIDCPGFEDPRMDPSGNDRKMCADLGIPIVVQHAHAKSILAAIVLIRYESIVSSTQDTPLQEVIQALSGLMNIQALLQLPKEERLPLLFVISNPEKQDKFDPDTIKANVLKRKQDIMDVLKSDFKAISEKKAVLLEYAKQLEDLGLMRDALQNLFELTKQSAYETGKTQQFIEECRKKFSEMFSPDNVALFEGIASNILADKNALPDCIATIANAITRKEQEKSKLREALESLEVQQFIFGSMEKENMFVFLGHSESAERNLRNAIFLYLAQLQDKSRDVVRQMLLFNSDRRIYLPLLHRVKAHSVECIKLLHTYAEARQNALSCQQEFQNRGQERKRYADELAGIMTATTGGTFAEQLKTSIASKEAELKKMDDSIQQNDKLLSLSRKTMLLHTNNQSLEEHSRDHIAENRTVVYSVFEKLRMRAVSKEFNFDIGAPIARVEVSSLLKDKKVVVKGGIGENIVGHSDSGFSQHAMRVQDVGEIILDGHEGIMQLVPKDGMIQTGRFSVVDCDLKNGRLKLTYLHDPEQPNYASVRVFVLHKDHPIYVKRFELYRQNVTNREASAATLRMNRAALQKRIESDRAFNAYIPKVSVSGDLKQTQERIERVKQLVFQLGYDLSYFISVYFPKCSSKTATWLINEKNYSNLQLLVRFSEEQLKRHNVDVDKRVLAVSLFGEEPSAGSGASCDDKEAADVMQTLSNNNINVNELVKMLAEKGFTLFHFCKMLLGIRGYIGDDDRLSTRLIAAEESCILSKSKFVHAHNQCGEYRIEFAVIQQLITLFSLKEHDSIYIEFLEAYEAHHKLIHDSASAPVFSDKDEAEEIAIGLVERSVPIGDMLHAYRKRFQARVDDGTLALVVPPRLSFSHS